MREHKYRVWLQTDDEPVTCSMVYFTLAELMMSYNDEDKFCELMDTDLFRKHQEINTDEAMSSTGLTDKNNAEVYEDDIVRNDDGDIYTIRWDRHLARFAFYWHDTSKKGSNKEWRSAEETITDFDMKARFEIIGNIDENFDLLEVGQ